MDDLKIEWDTEVGIVTVSQTRRNGVALVPPVSLEIPLADWILAGCRMTAGMIEEQKAKATGSLLGVTRPRAVRG